MRVKGSSRYSLKREIERAFAILEDILGCENILFVRDGNYDVSLGMKIVAYNIIILVNQMFQRQRG